MKIYLLKISIVQKFRWQQVSYRCINTSRQSCLILMENFLVRFQQAKLWWKKLLLVINHYTPYTYNLFAINYTISLAMFKEFLNQERAGQAGARLVS